MSGGQYYRIGRKAIAVGSLDSFNNTITDYERRYFFFKKKFASTFNNLVPDFSDYLWQFVCSDMRMRFVQYFFISAKLNQEV